MQQDNTQQNAETQKLRASVENLKRALENEKKERKWPWLVRTVLPAILISLGTGAVGYLFGDSLEERSRAEIRKDILDKYFSVDNDIAGKRMQMLNYIEDLHAKDDPELMEWVIEEKKIVRENMASLEEEIRTLEDEIKQLKKQGVVAANEQDIERAKERKNASSAKRLISGIYEPVDATASKKGLLTDAATKELLIKRLELLASKDKKKAKTKKEEVRSPRVKLSKEDGKQVP